MAQREELSSLFGCKKQQTSYGALRKQDNSNEFYIKHYVKTDETLAGICLKYGVQVLFVITYFTSYIIFC